MTVLKHTYRPAGTVPGSARASTYGRRYVFEIKFDVVDPLPTFGTTDAYASGFIVRPLAYGDGTWTAIGWNGTWDLVALIAGSFPDELTRAIAYEAAYHNHFVGELVGVDALCDRLIDLGFEWLTPYLPGRNAELYRTPPSADTSSHNIDYSYDGDNAD